MIQIHIVLIFHKNAIEDFGGSHGVRDWEGLKSALERPFQTFDQQELYNDAVSKAAALLESILLNHPFVDGNKRSAYSIARYFLRKNNMDIFATENEKYDFIIAIASGNMDFDSIIDWLSKHTAIIQ